MVDLSPYALITEAEYKAVKSTSLTDDQIRTLINRATTKIEKRCNRKFVHGELEEEDERDITDHFKTGANREINSDGRIYLRYRPIVTVKSITDPDGHFIDVDKLAIDKEVGFLEGYFFRTARMNGRPSTWEIVYVAGYFELTEDVDEDLKDACIETVADWIANPSGRRVASKSVGGDSISYAMPTLDLGSYQIPPVALSILQDGGWIASRFI